MIEFEAGPIAPTPENAITMRSVIAEDYERMGLSFYDAQERAFTDADGRDLVEWQIGRLERAPAFKYLGIFAAQQLVAFSVKNEWNAADQMPYARNVFELATLKLRSASTLTNEVQGKPLGLHSLQVTNDLNDSDQDKTIDMLLDDAVRFAYDLGDKEIRTQSYKDDPARRRLILPKYDFQPKAKGQPSAGIDFIQTQYVRTPRDTRVKGTKSPVTIRPKLV